MGEHKQCRDAECNICRGDTHVIGPNPDTARRRAMCYLDDYGEWREDPNTSTTEAALAESRGEVERRDALLYELNLLYAGLEQRLRRTVEGICNARSLQHAQEIANAALEAPHEST